MTYSETIVLIRLRARDDPLTRPRQILYILEFSLAVPTKLG